MWATLYYLIVNSLLDKKNRITGSKNITLRKGNVEPYGCSKMYMDKDLIEDKLYQLIDQIKINHIDFYFKLLGKIYPFY